MNGKMFSITEAFFSMWDTITGEHRTTRPSLVSELGVRTPGLPDFLSEQLLQKEDGAHICNEPHLKK